MVLGCGPTLCSCRVYEYSDKSAGMGRRAAGAQDGADLGRISMCWQWSPLLCGQVQGSPQVRH